MNDQLTFFDFAAEVGLTKHIGGIEATEKLVELCHIDADSYILDIGCGVGVTPVYIAKNHGCRVMGVDINPKMVERSMERAHKVGLADRVDFRVADMQELPFEDDTLDAVITESVIAFAGDKGKAMREFVRVTKPGGYVGLNETVWLKTPPPPEIVAWAQNQSLSSAVAPEATETWESLLVAAGLGDVVSVTYEIDEKAEAKGIFQRYGFWGMLRIMFRMFRLYTRSAAYRSFLKSVKEQGLTPDNLDKYFGYGIFVGRKQP